MLIALGCDHTGLELKSLVASLLQDLGHQVQDVGAYTLDPADDYPDFANALAELVATGKADRGIMVCGSGVGASVAANKTMGVRAAICHDIYSAHQGVEHDDMNVLCIGARIIGEELAKELVIAFVNATFSNDPRHARRLNKVRTIEEFNFTAPHTSNEKGKDQ